MKDAKAQSPHTDPNLLTAQTPVGSPQEVPAYISIRDDLMEEIRTGHLEEGAKLPSERDLAAHHGVARMTARQALGLLESEGAIYRSERRGYFVTAPRIKFNPVSTVNLMKQLRLQGLQSENIYLGREFLPATEWYARQFAVDEGTSLVMERNVVAVGGRKVLYEEVCLRLDAIPGYADRPYVSPLWQNLQQNFSIWPKRKSVSVRMTNISYIASQHLGVSSGTNGLSSLHVHEHEGRIMAVNRTFWLGDVVDIVIEDLN